MREVPALPLPPKPRFMLAMPGPLAKPKSTIEHAKRVKVGLGVTNLGKQN